MDRRSFFALRYSREEEEAHAFIKAGAAPRPWPSMRCFADDLLPAAPASRIIQGLVIPSLDAPPVEGTTGQTTTIRIEMTRFKPTDDDDAASTAALAPARGMRGGRRSRRVRFPGQSATAPPGALGDDV